jgi:hypothetical protein
MLGWGTLSLKQSPSSINAVSVPLSSRQRLSCRTAIGVFNDRKHTFWFLKYLLLRKPFGDP